MKTIMFVSGLHADASFYENESDVKNQQATILDEDLYPIWCTLELERKMNDIHEMAEKQKCVAV